MQNSSYQACPEEISSQKILTFRWLYTKTLVFFTGKIYFEI